MATVKRKQKLDEFESRAKTGKQTTIEKKRRWVWFDFFQFAFDFGFTLDFFSFFSYYFSFIFSMFFFDVRVSPKFSQKRSICNFLLIQHLFFNSFLSLFVLYLMWSG